MWHAMRHVSRYIGGERSEGVWMKDGEKMRWFGDWWCCEAMVGWQAITWCPDRVRQWWHDRRRLAEAVNNNLYWPSNMQYQRISHSHGYWLSSAPIGRVLIAWFSRGCRFPSDLDGMNAMKCQWRAAIMWHEIPPKIFHDIHAPFNYHIIAMGSADRQVEIISYSLVAYRFSEVGYWWRLEYYLRYLFSDGWCNILSGTNETER